MLTIQSIDNSFDNSLLCISNLYHMYTNILISIAAKDLAYYTTDDTCALCLLFCKLAL